MAKTNFVSGASIKEQEKKKAQKALLKNIFMIGAILLVGVSFWIIVEVFLLEKESTIPTSVTAVTRRMDTDLDAQALLAIENKRSWTADQLQRFPIFLTPESGTLNSDSLVIMEKGVVPNMNNRVVTVDTTEETTEETTESLEIEESIEITAPTIINSEL